MVTDSIADYLTRIRNAQQARHRIVEIPMSKMKKSITEILYDQGFILKYKFAEDEGKQGLIKIALLRAVNSSRDFVLSDSKIFTIQKRTISERIGNSILLNI